MNKDEVHEALMDNPRMESYYLRCIVECTEQIRYIYICHKCKHTYKYNVKWCTQSYWSESERRMIKCDGRCLEKIDENS